jgi:hypothetical protein
MVVEVVEFFASQYLHFAATLEVRTAHLQARNLQLQIRIQVTGDERLIVQRAQILGQLIEARFTIHMAATQP